jgi:hypothetical protein
MSDNQAFPRRAQAIRRRREDLQRLSTVGDLDDAKDVRHDWLAQAFGWPVSATTPSIKSPRSRTPCRY